MENAAVIKFHPKKKTHGIEGSLNPPTCNQPIRTRLSRPKFEVRSNKKYIKLTNKPTYLEKTHSPAVEYGESDKK
jgi:hypothetical protein